MIVREGQKVVRVPETFAYYDPETRKQIVRPMKGTVVYVHPKGRFHTVAFPCAGGAVRESFSGVAP